MVILNPGARHCAFTFDEGNAMVQSGVQILNAKSLAPKVGETHRLVVEIFLELCFFYGKLKEAIFVFAP
jgi:hypothetical protein